MINNRRIIFVANSSWCMYNFRLPVLKALQKEGYEIHILSPEDDYSQKLIDHGFIFYPISVDRKGKNIFKDVSLILTLKKIYKKVNPLLIFHYTIKPNIYGSLAARLSKIPSVAITTGLGYVFLNNNIISYLAKLLYRFSFKFPLEIWFLNRDDSIEFIRRKIIHQRKVRILPGEGVDLQHFKPAQKEQEAEFIFLLVGRLLRDKGIYEYVEAAKIVKKNQKNVKCVLLGPIDKDNPSFIPLSDIKKWEERGIIEYKAAVNDIRPDIEQADSIVLPSYREGISRFLLESAAMEKPIITTDVPGCRDIVDAGISGYICKKGDYSSLADKMEKMMSLTHRERTKMGKRGREKVAKEFSIEKVISIYSNYLQNFLLSHTMHKK